MADESSFDQEAAVRAWMRELAAIPVDHRPLPDARQLWWKAELLKRWDAQQQAVEPLEHAEPLQVGMGIAGALVLLGTLWSYVPAPGASVIFATVLGLSALVTLGAVTLRRLQRRD